MKHTSLLWRVASEHHNHIIFLLGTMHSASAPANYYYDRIIPYIDSCTYFFAESNLDHPMFQDSMRMDIPSWIGVRQLLTQKQYNTVKRILSQNTDLELDHIGHISPMMLTSFISEHFLHAGERLPLDLNLWNYAKSKNKILDGIESAQRQAEIFKKIPVQVQIDQLKDLLSHLSKNRRLIFRIANAYRNQNLKLLYQLSKRNMGGIRSILLYDRNQDMVNRINEIFKYLTGHAMVAIGAAHLPGEKGVLRLLSKEYRIQSVIL